MSAILAAILDFKKSHAGGERPPGLNIIETLTTIEKAKKRLSRDLTRIWVLPRDYK